MWSVVWNRFKGAKLARMSSGTYCVIRDLGLVKGGKGMKHHEVLVTFSATAFRAWCVAQGRASPVERLRSATDPHSGTESAPNLITR